MKRTICVVLIVITAALAGPAVAPVAGAHDRAACESAMLRLINNARTKRGLHKVCSQWALEKASIAHSRQMLADDFFSHFSAGGASFSERIRRAGYSRSGYSSWSVGEVIGWGKGAPGSAQAIFNAWMDSSAHRSVILTKRWRDCGVGCSQGNFQGRSDTLMWTVDFGRRVR